MTVYIGDIKASIAFLAATIEEAGDIERADAITRATISKAVVDLKTRLDQAISDADGSLQTALMQDGGFAPDMAKALLQAIDDQEQLSTLLAMRGYVGRVHLALGQVA